MEEFTQPKNYVVAVAAGYREEQIRPFLASLAHCRPDVALRLIVARHDPVFEDAVRAWIPDASFHLFPPTGLRDFAMRHKHVRSLLKRLTRWLPPPNFSRRLLKINYLRHLVIRDLVREWGLDAERVILIDSRDSVFQSDPFARDWPELWTGEEDRRIEECRLNSFWFKRVGGEEALQKARGHQIVCAGALGGTGWRIREFTTRSSSIIETLAPKVALGDGDQGVHNNLVRLEPGLGFMVLPNGSPLVSNIGYTDTNLLYVDGDRIYVKDNREAPSIIHQYDRHPKLVEWVQRRWASPPARRRK